MAEMQLLATCGLYCGACYHYQSGTLDGSHLLEDAARRGLDPTGYTCQGCRSNKLYIHPGCAECALRDCVEEKGLLHCGQCDGFPCEKLNAFRNDGRVHHLDIFTNLADLNALGAETWLEEQSRRWQCQCGASFSWYEETCHQCGAVLPSYGSNRAHS
jgi:hypothetical protein